MESLEAGSPEIRSALLLDGRGRVVAHAGAGEADSMREAVLELIAAAGTAAGRDGAAETARIEVSSPGGGVFAVRRDGGRAEAMTLVAVTAAGALPSLVLYDLRMGLAGIDGA